MNAQPPGTAVAPHAAVEDSEDDLRALADAGLAEWAARLDALDGGCADLFDPDAGVPIRWDDERGWIVG